MRPNWDQVVPGLAKARAEEQSARALAFLDVTETLLGVEVRPLTLRAQFELTEAGNLCMAGLVGPHPVIAAFLWRVSPKFCRPGSLRWHLTAGVRRRIKKHVAGMDPFKASVTIREWVKRQHQDAPPSVVEVDESGNDLPAKESGFYWLAGLIDFFAENYGWSEAETLDRPIPRIWQLYRANCSRKGHSIPLSPPSDAIRREYIASLILAQRRETEAKTQANQCSEKN